MRVRQLVFGDTPEKREEFSLLYQGFVTGGNTNSSKGIEVTRREAKILDKLEAVSDELGDNTPCETCGQIIPVKRVPKPGQQQIELEQPEFDLLKRYFEATPWNVRVARKIVNISDWLASIQPEER